jgi:hypothetical protein
VELQTAKSYGWTGQRRRRGNKSLKASKQTTNIIAVTNPGGAADSKVIRLDGAEGDGGNCWVLFHNHRVLEKERSNRVSEQVSEKKGRERDREKGNKERVRVRKGKRENRGEKEKGRTGEGTGERKREEMREREQRGREKRREKEWGEKTKARR